MVQHLKISGILVLALMISTRIHAQECGGGSSLSLGGTGVGFGIAAESGSVSVPFVMRSNHVIVSVEVKGKTFDVILDTGMPMEGIILFDNKKSQSLEIEYDEKLYVGGAAGGEPVPAELASGYDINLEGLTLSNQDILLMYQDSVKSCAFEGEEGIIGASIFNQLVVQIDYEKQQLTLIDPEKFTYSGDATSIPLIGAKRGTPQLKLAVTLSNGMTMDRTVVLDIGASHALALNTSPNHGVVLPEENVRTHLGTGIDGRIFGHIGRIKSLALGPHTLEDVVVSFTDLASASCGANSHGNLGHEILRRFDVTIDYSGDRMILQPNSDYSSPFTFDMTGLSLERTPSGNYRVFELVPGSPAIEVGMEINDIVTKINGTSAADIDRDNLTSLLRGEAGMTLVVEIDRPHETVEMKLHLRRII